MISLVKKALISSLIKLILAAFSDRALKALFVAGIDRAIKSDHTGEEIDAWLEEVKISFIESKEE